MLEGPKPIRCEEKLVVVFCHPPKDQQTEEFKCWALHRFVHVTEEGDEAGLFSTEDGGGENNSGAPEGTNQNLNITDLAENPQENQENVPSEVAWFFDSETAGMNRDNAALIANICPFMVDDDNQPLPENIPTEEQQATTANLPQIFLHGGMVGAAITVLKEGGSTRPDSVSTLMSTQQSNSSSRCFPERISSLKSSFQKPTNTSKKTSIGQ